MESKTIKLVQDSFQKVVPIASTAATLFYDKLFELDPTLRPLFKGDIQEQGTKLMNMLGTAVKGLSNLEALVPAVQALGKRHIAYGIKDQHYDTVGIALIWTLGQGLGDDFTDEVKQAWLETYGVLSSVMKDAANNA